MKQWKRKFKQQAGFTLAEVLLTVAIIVVLCSVAFVSYTQWQRAAQFRHNNDVANTLYAVLQSELSERRANNTLDAAEETMEQGGQALTNDDLALITTATGNKNLSYDTVYDYDDSDEKYAKLDRGPIYSIIGNAATWKDYNGGDYSKITPQLKLLYDMLSEYLYAGDYSLLDGAVCAEIDFSEGIVYSVFFTDVDGVALSYSKDEPGNGNLLNRETSKRRNHTDKNNVYDLVGYCGVETMSLSTSKQTVKPVIEELSLNNEETLNLTFKLTTEGLNSTAPTLAMTYTIKLFNADEKTELLTIEMNKLKVNEVNDEKYNLVNATDGKTGYLVDCRVKYKDDTYYLTFPAWVEEETVSAVTTARVHLVLDAVDYNTASQANQTAYETYIDSWNSSADNKPIAALANTFSIYRLGIEDADNIYCTVSASGDGFVTSATKQSNNANRAFASTTTATTETETTRTIEIANARHLYNIRFEETRKASNNTKYSSLYENYTISSNSNVDFEALSGYIYTYKGENELGAYDIANLTDPEKSNTNTTLGTTLCAQTSVTNIVDATDISSANSSVKESGKQFFPSLPTLSEESTLTSKNEDGYGRTLSNFTFTKEDNIAWGVVTTGNETTGNDEDGTGLFLRNEGTIQNVTLADVTVNGVTTANGYTSDRTGAFCGTNAGTLSNLMVSSSSTGASGETGSSVTGDKYVGGVFGYYEMPDSITEPITLSKLVNQANVSGNRYVGGIVGLLSGESVTLSACKNYGSVTAVDTKQNGTDGLTTLAEGDDTQPPAFIGGIVGLADGAALTGCLSNPQSSKPTEEQLSGYCVGGLVGLAYNVQLSECSTRLDSGYDRGYVYGDRYVGGIVGLSVGKSVIGGSSDQNGKFLGNTLNDMNVVGNAYVGGVVGCNAVVKILETNAEPAEPGVTEFGEAAKAAQSLSAFITEKGQTWYDELDPQRITPTSTRPSKNNNDTPSTAEVDTVTTTGDDSASIIVQYWTNQGTVTAYDYYAGGITGYNTGDVYDCESSVHTSEQNGGTCDYAGGIAGYNNGTLKAQGETTTLTVECYVTGNNFVGGVVGYNDVDATVNNYTVAGGTVQGSGSFVGGFAGLNASVKLLQEEKTIADGTTTTTPVKINANLNSISGKYAVGGIIGGNIVPTLEKETVLANFNVNNFLGTISGDVVVGGYIGFNALPVVTNKEDSRDSLRQALTETDIVKNDQTDRSANAILAALETVAEANITAANTTENDKLATLTIGDEKSDTTVTYSSGITGQIAVGGVIGYSSKNTKLNINNVINKVPVTATQKIAYEQLQGVIGTLEQSQVSKEGLDTSINDKETYSLVGGILGVVNENTTLTNCQNADIGNVKGAGTYHGGLAELNLGTIQACTIASIGESSQNYVGGLVGINFGEISGTKASKATVTGGEYTGGIVAENYGTITLDGKIEGLTVQSTGKYAGGVAGYNGKTSEDKTGNIQMNQALEVNVSSTAYGSYVGGVVGHNASGNIAAVKLTDDKGNKIEITDASVKGAVTGGSNTKPDGYDEEKQGFGGVGGIIGKHESGKLENLVNQATVTANSGNAAGIVDETETDTTITACINSGSVTANGGGAAGIVGTNAATISQCANYGSITAPGGSAGGICVENSGAIENCAVTAPENTTDNWWERIADWIKALFGKDTTTTVTVQGRQNAGGIAANNSGTVSGSTLKNLSVCNYTNSTSTSLVGGVAGSNSGTISLAAVQEDGETEEASAANGIDSVLVTTNVNGSAAGGIAGNNSGIIDGTVGETDNVVISGTSEKEPEKIPTKYTVYESVTTQAWGQGINTDGNVTYTGSTYFDTGYQPTKSTQVKFDGCVIGGDTALFGSRRSKSGSNLQRFTIQAIATAEYRVTYNERERSNISNSTIPLGQRAVFTMNSEKATIERNGQVIVTDEYNATAFDSDYALYISAMNTGNVAGNFGVVQMYSMDITDDNGTWTYLPASYTTDEGVEKKGLLKIPSDAQEEGDLTFIEYTTTNASYSVTLEGTGEAYYIEVGETTIQNFTIATGSAVTFANLGNVAGVNAAGVNAEGATIKNVTVKDSKFDSSVQSLVGGDDYGYGGIAGLNGGSITGTNFSGEIIVAGSNAAIANVGGIAGKNLATGSIEDCTVGMNGNTTVKTTGFGYLGGITGWNFGSVTNCDSRTESDKQNSEGENATDAAASDTTETKKVNITNQKGHTGGIIGYAAAGSLVNGSSADTPTATGSNWAVTCSKYSNDCGTGGIIGYSESGNRNQDMQYLYNYASVKNSGEGSASNVAIGGIIGRFQNNENGNMTLYRCHNYGTLTGATDQGIVGGVVGRMKYNSATFRECTNSGTITGNYVGGLMGDSYQNNSNNKNNYFYNCTNTGEINGGSAAGGIAGRVHQDGRTANFYECVNAGTIQNATNKEAEKGGIAGTSADDASFVRCRNYGTINGTGYGMSKAATSVLDCFDIQWNIRSTLTNSTNWVDSYFFSGELLDTELDALQAWLDSPSRQLKDELAQAAELAASAQAANDQNKKGLPLSYYVTSDNTLQITSYKIGTVEQNSVAAFGIPNYTEAAVRKDATIPEETTDFYTALETQKNSAGYSLMEQYYRDKYATTLAVDKTNVANLKLEQVGDVLTAKWTALEGAYGYKLYYELTDQNKNVEYYVSSLIYGKPKSTVEWSVNIPENWIGGEIKVYVRAVNGSEEIWKVPEDTDSTEPWITYESYSTELVANNKFVTATQELDKTAAENDKTTKYSWSAVAKPILSILPAPDVYLELDGVTAGGTAVDTGNYIAVLRNTADYDAYLESNDETITITVTVGGSQTHTIKYQKGNLMSAHSIAGATIGSTNSSQTIKASAKTETNASLAISQQTYMLNGASLMGNTHLKATFDGFTGVLPTELAFGVTMTGVTNSDNLFVYQETELLTTRTITLAENNKLQVQAAVSSNVTRRTGGESPSIILDDLPEDLLEGDDPEQSSKQFTVRNYPWHGQNDAIYFGHVVAEGLTQDDLLLKQEDGAYALEDPHRNGEKVFGSSADSSVTLNPGYVIYQNVADDGTVTYDVRYSAILAKESAGTYQKNLNQCVYSYDPAKRNDDGQIKVTGTVPDGCVGENGVSTNTTIQPYPVIEAGTFEDSGNSSSYQFTWADSTAWTGSTDETDPTEEHPKTAVDSEATYMLQLYGVDADGSRVLLRTVDLVDKTSQDESVSQDGSKIMPKDCYSETGWQYTFVDQDNAWSYAFLCLRVVRVGEGVENGYTTVWPYYNELSVKLRQRFTTLTAPTVTVPSNRGTMDYTVEWSAIPVEEQTEDFLCYEITVTDVTDTTQYPEHLLVDEHKYYIYGKPSTTGEESGTETANVFYVSNDKLDDPTTQGLVSDPTITSAVLDLEEFASAEVSVSVRALATSDAATYRDGAEGTKRTLQLAERLPVPDLGKLKMSPCGEDEVPTLRAVIVSGGVKLTMDEDAERYGTYQNEENETVGLNVSGLYEVQLFIYATKDDAEPLYTVNFDEPQYMSGRLNAGASTYTVPNELQATDAEGDTAVIKLSDLAGQYLGVQLRATADSYIYSTWTEVKRLQLPRMQLDAPTLSDAGTGSFSYKVAKDGDIDGYDSETKVDQQTITWTDDPTNGGYTIYLTQALDDQNDKVQRKALEITLGRNDEGALTIGEEVLPTTTETNQMYQIESYCVELEQEATTGAMESIKLYAYLTVHDGQVYLYLPDNDDADTEFLIDTTGRWTRNITVVAVSPDKEKNYISSQGSYMARPTTSDVWNTGTVDRSTLPKISLSASMITTNEEKTTMTIDLSDVEGADTYRLMARIYAKETTTTDAAGEEQSTVAETVHELSMTATDDKKHELNSADIPGDWTSMTITGIEIRVINTNNSELVGDWSETSTLTLELKKTATPETPETATGETATPETAETATGETATPETAETALTPETAESAETAEGAETTESAQSGETASSAASEIISPESTPSQAASNQEPTPQPTAAASTSVDASSSAAQSQAASSQAASSAA